MPFKSTQNDDPMEKRRIGVIAGWGNFPVRVAETLVASGCEVYCVAIKGHADPVLADICTEFRAFGLARMGAQVRYLRRAGVTQATLAGKIFKSILFKRKRDLIQHFPDVMFWRHFYPIYLSQTKDRRDDTLLSTVVQLYAAGGITLTAATDFAPELLVKKGILTRKSPTKSQMRDVEFGWEMAKEMGRLDIGQSVVVKNQAVMAVEAIEGTDDCIRRAGQICQGNFTVVKVAKPNQDMRFDVPTVGQGTIETIHASGGSVLAIEANKTIILEQDETIAAANRLGISIVAIDPENESTAPRSALVQPASATI